MKTVFPDYDHCLTNVANSLLKYYDLETFHNSLGELDQILNEKKWKNVVVLLYDGMGVNLLKRNLDETDFLLRYKLRDISAVFPPTTTASTTSILSGKNPNEHGWLGWDLYFPEIEKVVTMFTNTYKDTETPIPIENISRKTYPYASIIKRISEKTNAVGLFPFKDTRFKDIEDMHFQIEAICNNDKTNFIYAYYDDPDHVMHVMGTDSQEAKDTFRMINNMTEDLCKKLHDTLVIVVADHGHINSQVITLKEYPDLFACLERDVSIEPRACSFKVKEGKKEEFEELFKKYFESDFLLLSKEEVIEKKLFGAGTNNPHFDEVIGDYLAIAISDKYFRYNENSANFKSMHAGLTEDEMVVPLILYKS